MVKMSRRRFLGLGLGGAAGGLAGYVIGNSLDGLFGAIEESARDFRVISSFDSKDKRHFEAILGDISESRRGNYESNNNQRTALYQGSWDYMESLQRQALKTPGAETAPVKEVRDVKKRLFEWTKGLFGDEAKKEAEIQSNPRYSENYNGLASLRVSLMERIGALEEGMNDISYKIRANESNTHYLDDSGRKILYDLMDQHERSFELLRGFRSLTPEQVLEGANDLKYKELVETARSYGIKPYVPNGILSNYSSLGIAAMGVFFGAMLGSFVTGKGEYVVRTVGGALKDLGSLAAKPFKVLKRSRSGKNK